MSAYESKENLRKVGTRLQELRKKYQINQEALAEYMKVPRSTVAKWENGVQDFRSEQIVRLANKFGVSTDYLLLGVSAETFEIYNTTGLVDAAVNKLNSRRSIEEDFLDGKFGTIDLLNEILPDDELYSLMSEFIRLRAAWRSIQAKIKEQEKLKKQVELRNSIWKEAEVKINELREKSEFLMWKHTHSIDTFMRKLLEG